MSSAALKLLVLCGLTAFINISADAAEGVGKPSIEQLRNEGILSFPQKDARVIHDRPDLRVSVYNNDSYLYVQVIVWNDNDSKTGKSEDGKEIGDYSVLMFHHGKGRQRTPYRDRDYLINPWPDMPGLYFVEQVGARKTTTLKKDTEYRGDIRYVDTIEGRRVRVDSYYLALPDLRLQPGDSVSVAYYAKSPVPALIVNSVKPMPANQYYADYHLPVEEFRRIILRKDGVRFSYPSPEDTPLKEGAAPADASNR